MVGLTKMSLYGKFFKLLIKNASFDNYSRSAQVIDQEKVSSDAIDFVKTIETLGPTFIKFGQVLSTRKTMLPTAFLEELQRMQDDVTPIDTSEIIAVVETELGMPIDHLFKSFEYQPLSCASLGQVHRATLKDGQEVVVKIQKPGITKIIEKDLLLMKRSISLLSEVSENFKRYHVEGILDDFKTNIRRELDYKEEAANLEIISSNLEDFKKIVFPKVYNSYSTNRVLTMEFVKGEKISNISPLRRTELDVKKITENIFKAYLKQILVDGFIHSDPHLGNLLLMSNDSIAILDLGMVTKIGPSLQKDLQYLLLKISEGKATDASEIALKLALPMREFEDDVIEFKQKIYKLVKNEQGKALDKIRVGESLMGITDIAAQTGFKFPEEFTSIARTLMYLDELALCLYPKFDPQESLRNHIIGYISESYKKNLSIKNILNDSMELKDIIETVPKKLNTILEDIIDRRLKIRVDVIDEDKLISGFEKIANRVTTGLVISSLIIGATTLMKYESSFTVFGYPGMAMILLLIATLCAFLLLTNVLIRDR